MSNRRYACVYDSANNNLEIGFPITPFVTVKQGMNVNSQDLFGFGEIDSGASIKLDAWSCESLFPDINNEYEFVVPGTQADAFYYVNMFTKIMKEQHILIFKYYSLDPYVQYVDKYCKITGFSYGEKNGSKDIYYTLDFKEYKELKLVDQYIINNTEIAKNYGSDTYYVKEGDTLLGIAAKIYGDSTKWSYLMNRNSLKNPLDISVGQALTL